MPSQHVEPYPSAGPAEREIQGSATDFINLLPHTRAVVSQRPKLLVASVVVAVLVVDAAAVWFVGRTSNPPPPSATYSTTSTAAPAEALARLRGLLPPGYPAGACMPASSAANAAVITCGDNSDPGGPRTGTYTLASTPEALRDALDQLIQTTAVVICPGNIRSLGPWRRNDTPTVTRGTVLCGLLDGRPRVVWTNDADRRRADAQARSPDDPPLDKLMNPP